MASVLAATTGSPFLAMIMVFEISLDYPLMPPLKRFLTSATNFVPVVDGDRRLVGVVALQDLKEHLGAGAELRVVIVSDVMRPPPPVVTPDQRLVDVLNLALASQQQNILMISSLKRMRLVSALSRTHVLGLFVETIAVRRKLHV